MTPAMSSATPNQTVARCSSRRTIGSRNSVGPGRSTWGSTGGCWAILVAAPPQRAPGPARAKRPEPADRVQDFRAAIEREGDEFCAAADILPRHRATKSVLRRPEAEPAVGAPVAVVAHHEDMVGGYLDRAEIVAGAHSKIDGVVARPARQRFADDRQPAIFAVAGAHDGAREFDPAR